MTQPINSIEDHLDQATALVEANSHSVQEAAEAVSANTSGLIDVADASAAIRSRLHRLSSTTTPSVAPDGYPFPHAGWA